MAHHDPGDSDVTEAYGPARFAQGVRLTVMSGDYLEQLVTRVGRDLSKARVLAGVERHHLRELQKKHGLRGSEEG